MPHDLLGRSLRGKASEVDDAVADLHALRSRAAEALSSGGIGPVGRSSLLRAGLDAEECRVAAEIEARRLRDPGLYPGIAKTERGRAIERANLNARTHLYLDFWRALEDLVAGEREHDGRLHIRAGAGGLHEIVVMGIKTIHASLRSKPILHLDATLRPELARSVLQDLEVTEIDAAAPNMSLRLVTGGFGKTSLCQDRRASAEESRRRSNRLRECVDYVRWQALRFAPGRVLVVTHMDCEAAFAAIPGVEVAHFNAIAGLDAYRDVRLLIVVGRPLPPDAALLPLCGVFFRHLPAPGYQPVQRGVRMRDGTSQAVQVLAHPDPHAEVLRAAICEDEVFQAIGRGRGVNRTAENPLEVHVLADVALPLVHDRVLSWDTVAPDIVQRMLLAGVAVDSPDGRDGAASAPLRQRKGCREGVRAVGI